MLCRIVVPDKVDLPVLAVALQDVHADEVDDGSNLGMQLPRVMKLGGEVQQRTPPFAEHCSEVQAIALGSNLPSPCVERLKSESIPSNANLSHSFSSQEPWRDERKKATAGSDVERCR